MRNASFAIIYTTVLFLFVNSVMAESPSSGGVGAEQAAEITQGISETTMSPFCPGRTLSSCPSDQARLLREEIDSWVRQGMSAEAVRNRLIVTYGDDVRGTPETEGFGLMAWVIPVVFLVCSLLLLWLKLKNLRNGNLAQASEHNVRREKEMTERAISRVEEELAKRAG